MSVVAGVMVLVAAAVGADWSPAMPEADLAGWTAVGGDWRVEDSVVVGEAADGQSGWLVRAGDLADFELEAEVRFEGNGLGALVFRGHLLPVLPVPEGAKPEEVAYTVYGYGVALGGEEPGSLVEVHDCGQVAESHGDAQGAYAGDGWNQVRVVARDLEVEVWVNGVRAVSGRAEAYTTGSVALMALGGRVSCRDLRIRDMGRSRDWRALFDGKDLSGWVTWGTEDWSVADGVIVGKSGPDKSEGYLETEETWGNFHVRGQYRMLGDGNFGLFFHSKIRYDEKRYPMIAGVQGEVAPGWPSPSGLMYESYLRGWLVEPDMSLVSAYAQRPGDWNEIEIRCEGNRRQSWVNGVGGWIGMIRRRIMSRGRLRCSCTPGAWMGSSGGSCM